jgi:dTDP-4-dehydrorhamnose reductase
MLGRDLVPVLQRNRYTVYGVDVDQFDITQENQVHRTIESCMPNLVVNCAAYTAVDKAEKERDRAFAVNRDGADFLAKACAKSRLPMIHISTDYVFDGEKRRPYLEDDPANPLNTYGRSKWEGEQAIRSCLEDHIIIRTSWLFGAYGQNFVKSILRLAKESDRLQVVDDQKGCPTWTGDLSDALTRLAGEILTNKRSTPWGTYHFCGKGNTTWHEFATCIIEESEKGERLKATRVIPIRTSDYPTAAKRPAWSVLDCGKIERTFAVHPRPWREGLHKVLDTLLCENSP